MRPSAADTTRFSSCGIGRTGSLKNCKMNKEIIQIGIAVSKEKKLITILVITEIVKNNHPSLATIGYLLFFF